MDEYIIRRMKVEDVDCIYEIECASFPDPWSKESLLLELTSNAFAYYLVVELDGDVVGYGGMWIILDEAQITNIAIAAQFRGCGWGEKLMVEMQRHAIILGATAMTLEVRTSNIAAQQLYKKLGFYQAGIRPRYYSDNNEDALIMWVVFEHEEGQQLEKKSATIL